LRFLTPRNHGHAAWAYVSSLGGGMVDGDLLQTQIHLEKGAHGFLSTQGPTRVFRSTRGCISRWTATLEEEALLVSAPDPVSLFARARCLQETRITLAAGSSCAWLEILTSGRPAHGERWAFHTFENRFTVEREGQAVVRERLLLSQDQGSLQARLGRFEALGNLWLLGPRLRETAQELRQQWNAPPERRSDAVVVMSELGADLWVGRWACATTESALKIGRALLSFVPSLLGDDPLCRRP